VGGVACGGFVTLDQGNPWCRLDPDYPMDWHLHCPPGATNCPNLETGSCVGNCSYRTNDSQRATSPPNSLHMAAHWNITPDPPGQNPDVTHFRTLQGFVTPPMNLTGLPRPGDLQASFFHIARLVDSEGTDMGRGFAQCGDCAQLQIQVDTDPAPAIDAWGFWDVLVPYQNTYDHTPLIASTESPYYCIFTPTDTGTAPKSPNGAHETICKPQGAWSSCGSVNGTTPTATYDCAGPGVVDPTGTGVWVESRFDLSQYLGQRVRIRWIAETWVWDGTTSSYFEIDAAPGGQWSIINLDDGWWLDDIKVTGLVTRQTTPVLDTRPPPGGVCPVPLCVDGDGDGYNGPGAPPCAASVPVDCDDTQARTFPGADEFNDGLDNQCPGWPGFGLVDELNETMAFYLIQYVYDLGVPFQRGASQYDVVYSPRKDFSGDCTVQTVPPGVFVPSPETPPVGQVYYYLERARSPHVGSWGADSAGHERTGVCGL
jgi:hypothetical protein